MCHDGFWSVPSGEIAQNGSHWIGGLGDTTNCSRASHDALGSTLAALFERAKRIFRWHFVSVGT
jgi:hypothetical protein